LAGLAGYKFLTKMFQKFLEMKTPTPFYQWIIYLLDEALIWAKPGPGTTSCLPQLFRIFIMTQAASRRSLRHNNK